MYTWCVCVCVGALCGFPVDRLSRLFWFSVCGECTLGVCVCNCVVCVVRVYLMCVGVLPVVSVHLVSV